MKYFRYESLRFLIAGGCNTLITYTLYLVLLIFLSYWIAFTISFFVGMFISLFMNSKFVFQVSVGRVKLIQYPLLYLLQYFFGLTFLFILVSGLGMNERLASIVNLVLLPPISYFANKRFLSNE